MIRNLIAALIFLMPLALQAKGINYNLVPVDTAYSATSVNVAYRSIRVLKSL